MMIWRTTGVVLAIIGLAVVPPVPAAETTAARTVPVQLTGSDSLGDGTALVMGPSSIPIPSRGYLELANQLYLQPRGFGGTPQILATPEGLYPVTGVKSLTLDASVAQGQQILANAVQQQIASGAVTADNPAVVFGWSQSSTVSSAAMSQLHDQGVPSDDVHFVLVGDPSNPNGGLLERFNLPIGGHSPTVPSLGITFSGATPSDLYPTDIYTNEYDGFADFPRYPINFLADLNAYLGIAFQHITYLSLTPDQVANAVELPTSTADTLTHHYMIPAENLPLLQPLQFVPFIGQPLYDLLEPVTRILVNLGYGSITDGWDPGPADVPTTFGLFPTDIDPGELLTALGNGLLQGVSDAVQQLLNPDNYNLAAILDNPFLQQVVQLTHALGFTDATDVSQLLSLPTLLDLARVGLGSATGFPTSDASVFSSSPTEIINSLTGTVSGDYATLLPIADTFNALLTTVPSVLASFVADELSQGNILGAIGDPIAAAVGLVPFALIFGAAAPVAIAAGGTLVNLAELAGLGDLPDVAP